MPTGTWPFDGDATDPATHEPMPTDTSDQPMPTENTAATELESPFLSFRIFHRDGSNRMYRLSNGTTKQLREMMAKGVIIARQAPDPTIGPNRQTKLWLIPTGAINEVEVIG